MSCFRGSSGSGHGLKMRCADWLLCFDLRFLLSLIKLELSHFTIRNSLASKVLLQPEFSAMIPTGIWKQAMSQLD